MKKILIIMSLILVLCLAACSGRGSDADTMHETGIEDTKINDDNTDNSDGGLNEAGLLQTDDNDKSGSETSGTTESSTDDKEIEASTAEDDTETGRKTTKIEFVPNEGASVFYKADRYDGTIPVRYLDMCGIPHAVNDFLQGGDFSRDRLLECLGEPDETVVHDLADISEDVMGYSYHHYCYRTPNGCTYYARYIAMDHSEDLARWKFGGFYVDYDDIYEDISYNDVYEKVRKADYSAHAIYDITPFQAAMIITFRGTEMRRREIHVSTLSDEQFSVKALENKMGQYGLLRYFDDEKCYISWCLPNSELVGMYLFYTSEYGSVEVDDGVFYHKFFRKDDLDELGVKYND